METEGFEGSLSASFRGAFSVGLSARLPRIPGKAPGIEGTDVSTGSADGLHVLPGGRS